MKYEVYCWHEDGERAVWAWHCPTLTDAKAYARELISRGYAGAYVVGPRGATRYRVSR